MSDIAKSMADFWSAQSKAVLEAQQKAARSITEGMQAMLSGKVPSVPELGPELGAANVQMAQASEALMQLWSTATNLSGELAGKMARYVGGGTKDEMASAVVARMVDPRQWMAGTGELDDVLTRMAEGPRLADLWDLERRYARVMKDWAELRRCTFEHQRVVLDAWLRAGRQYMDELAGQSSAEGKPLEPKRAVQLWTEIANRELLHIQRSEAFLQSQREMIRASTELRLGQQDLVEHFGKQYGFPTRTELDDVHRTITQMRRELRAMRRQASQAAPVPAEPAAPARASKRKVTS